MQCSSLVPRVTPILVDYPPLPGPVRTLRTAYVSRDHMVLPSYSRLCFFCSAYPILPRCRETSPLTSCNLSFQIRATVLCTAPHRTARAPSSSVRCPLG